MGVVMTIPLDPDICTALIHSRLWRTTAYGDCLLWNGRTREGYGQIWLPRYADGSRQRVSVHRVALVTKLGRDILDGLQAGHVCHDEALLAGRCQSSEESPCHHRRCVNPAHLGEQTPKANSSAPARYRYPSACAS